MSHLEKLCGKQGCRERAGGGQTALGLCGGLVKRHNAIFFLIVVSLYSKEPRKIVCLDLCPTS
jgi:hypothetical protein